MKSSQDIELSWVLLHDKVLRSECWVHPQAEVWWVEVCPSGLEISSILPNGRWNENDMHMKVISILGLIQMTWAQLFLPSATLPTLPPKGQTPEWQIHVLWWRSPCGETWQSLQLFDNGWAGTWKFWDSIGWFIFGVAQGVLMKDWLFCVSMATWLVDCRCILLPTSVSGDAVLVSFLSHEMDVKGKRCLAYNTYLFGNEQSGQRRRLTCRNFSRQMLSQSNEWEQLLQVLLSELVHSLSWKINVMIQSTTRS